MQVFIRGNDQFMVRFSKGWKKVKPDKFALQRVINDHQVKHGIMADD